MKNISMPKIGITIRNIVLTLIGLFILAVATGSYFTVQPGEIGLVKTFGKLSNTNYTQGLHFKLPIISSVVIMNVQIQKLIVTNADSSSKDLQSVASDIAVNYSIKPNRARDIYSDIGTKTILENTLIIPSVEESIKKATSLFTAEELITKRQEVREAMVLNLKEKLEIHGLNVVDVNIVNFSFSAEFDQAIEEKVRAEQEALTEQNRLETAKFKAEQKIVEAKAQAEAIRIQAQAITQQGGQSYVDLQWINKWNGQLPQVQTQGAGGGIFVDVRD